MPNLQITELITDPDFCQSFTITRLTGSVVKGDFITTPETFETTGIIRPANTNDIQMVPEGDRVTGMVTVYTSNQLYVTRRNGSNAPGLSDEITWQGEQYKIIQTANYSDYGYFKSMAVRKLGA